MDYKDDKMWLKQGDCLERMKEIESGSVDAIICDPPYGTVKGMGKGEERYKRLAESDWDVTLQLGSLLEQCNRILRTNGAMVLFSQEPYTSHLIKNTHNNIPFSYRMIWLKDHFANCLLANKAPVSYIEDINVFFKKYDTLAQNPIRQYSKKILNHVNINIKQINEKLGHRKSEHFFYTESTQFGLCTETTYNQITKVFCIGNESWFVPYDELERINKEFNSKFSRRFNLPEGQKYKSNVLNYRKDYGGLHPTQKPVALMEDLVYTYTNECETVLDFTMGSGTTGVACQNLNRKFIGIELDESYFKIAKDRILSTNPFGV